MTAAYRFTRGAPLPDLTLDWPIATAGVELLARSESCSLTAYLCPAAVATIGWGETDGVFPGERWTQAECDAALLRALRAFTARVRAMARPDTTLAELSALTVLAYNIGLAALQRSSVLRAHNARKPQAAARAFALYTKARVGGKLKSLRGLEIRRAAEAALYLSDAAEPVPAPGLDAPAVAEPSPSPATPLPQAVQPPAAPVHPAGAVAAATGVLTALGSLQEPAAQAGAAAQAVQAAAVQASGAVSVVATGLGVKPPLLIALALLALGAWLLYQRVVDRREGVK